MNKVYKMWGIKVRGKHDLFVAWDRSHHAKEHCKKLSDKGIRCKVVRVECREVDCFSTQKLTDTAIKQEIESEDKEK